MSPVEMKLRNAATMPTPASPPMHKQGATTTDKAARQDKEEESSSSLLPRLHLPGHKSRHSRDLRDGGSKDKEKDGSHTHHFPLRRSHSHRHTLSDVLRGSNNNSSATNLDLAHQVLGRSSGVFSRVATNLSSKSTADHKHKPRHQHSSSDTHKGFYAGTAAALTGNAGRPDSHRRAASDPRAPGYSRTGYQNLAGEGQESSGTGGKAPDQEVQKPMSEVEQLLSKAEKAKKDAEQQVSEADVQRVTTQLAESNVELQDRLASTDRTTSKLMRRLDEAHDSLLRTASSLIDTISSFQNLCQQSGALATNFEVKVNELDNEMRASMEKQRAAIFDERGEKVAKLEERSKKANDRAEEMSKRLENCRTIVQNYTQRQKIKQRAWKGVLVGSLWGCGFILSGILLGLALWWYKSRGGNVSHDVHEAVVLALNREGLGGVHGHVHQLVKERQRMQMPGEEDRAKTFENVPDDVRALLEDIAGRHNGTIEEESPAQYPTEASPEASLDEDERLKKLFDKLEL